MMTGKPLKPGDTFFVDQYNAEFNRSIQPMKGGYTDNYYMQMAANIRSARPVEPYKGKGIKYAGEKVRRKAGKAASAGKGGGA